MTGFRPGQIHVFICHVVAEIDAASKGRICLKKRHPPVDMACCLFNIRIEICHGQISVGDSIINIMTGFCPGQIRVFIFHVVHSDGGHIIPEHKYKRARRCSTRRLNYTIKTTIDIIFKAATMLESLRRNNNAIKNWVKASRIDDRRWDSVGRITPSDPPSWS